MVNKQSTTTTPTGVHCRMYTYHRKQLRTQESTIACLCVHVCVLCVCAHRWPLCMYACAVHKCVVSKRMLSPCTRMEIEEF